MAIPRNGNAQKKERRTTVAHDTLAKGHTKQHMADAPYGARLQVLLSCSRAIAQVGDLS
ncbi:hypothetical protein Pan241w_58270 [Gimesia alba]|uniref:Uncharacterized protein n=1 Tax=Gimesia alba TaxID=2527973 RepID=A0A517RD04_9PLAN|nr:hypothetical protein Pan241w_18280 [Gimesia alba]QDT45700.1 hypothetical protein Pan241w_58270 [Gimesia alba]